MLKVLHIISGGDVGGAKSHVLSLVQTLQKNISVKIICFMEGSFYDDAKAMGIDIQILKQKNRFDLKVVDEIAAMIKAQNYNIVHCHGARANFIGRFLKNKVQIPCVTTVHSDFMLDFKGNWYKYILFTQLNVFALKKFDYYIAVSEDFKKMLIERHFPKDKIFTVYNGIDFDETIHAEDRSTFLKAHGLAHLQDKLLVGLIARLHPVKGHKVFLEAAAEVLRHFEHVHFLLAGDGEERENLQRHAQKLGIEDHVHFMGFINNPYDFLNCLDINTLTSFSESFPYVLLEGAKLSKATISSAVGGIPLLIKDNETGCLFNAGDSNTLGEKMKELISDEAKREEMGSRLHAHARANYSLDNLAKEHLKIYNMMLKDKNKSY